MVPNNFTKCMEYFEGSEAIFRGINKAWVLLSCSVAFFRDISQSLCFLFFFQNAFFFLISLDLFAFPSLPAGRLDSHSGHYYYAICITKTSQTRHRTESRVK